MSLIGKRVRDQNGDPAGTILSISDIGIAMVQWDGPTGESEATFIENFNIVWLTDELQDLAMDRAAGLFIGGENIKNIAWGGTTWKGVSNMTDTELLEVCGIDSAENDPRPNWASIDVDVDKDGNPNELQLKAFLKYGDASLCSMCGEGQHPESECPKKE